MDAELRGLPEERLAPTAQAALLRGLHTHPTPLAVLWLACAHLAAYGRLPDGVLHRCGNT